MDDHFRSSHLPLDFIPNNEVATNPADGTDYYYYYYYCPPRPFLPHSIQLPVEYDTQLDHDMFMNPFMDKGTSSGIRLMQPIPVIPVSSASSFQTTVLPSYPLPTMTGVLVPQRPYRLPYSDHRQPRPVSMAPIYFTMEDGSKLKVENAINGVYEGLVDRDAVTAFPSSSISIRIEWPGYVAWYRQIKTRDFKSPPRPITLGKLAQDIGKCLKRFMEKMQSVPIDRLSQSWRVGSVDDPSSISVNDIAIVGIENVSKSSWQPILYRVS